MEHAQPRGIDLPPSNKDQVAQSKEWTRDLPYERAHDPTAGVTYERLHPGLPDLVLPLTFLAVTLLGILFVLIVLIIWLRTYVTCAPKKYESRVRSKAKESRLLCMMEPNEKDVKFKVVLDDSDANARDDVDDFEFKLPSVLKDASDFKYIDESDHARNISPPVVKVSNNGGGSPRAVESDSKDDADKTAESKEKFVFPNEVRGNKSGRFKIALSDQTWMMQRKPSDWRGFINMPKAFSFIEGDLSSAGAHSEGTSRRLSATRSPSLERDEKSPFYIGRMDSESSYEREAADKRQTENVSPLVEVRVQPLITDIQCASFERHERVKRYSSPNAGLRICTMNENVNPSFQTEKIEMQNSPRLVDSAPGKENNPSPRFTFSPKFFDCKSPKFFASPDQRSPIYFAENRSRNSSPKLAGSADKPLSPRFVYADAHKTTRSPLVANNGNYFKFEQDAPADNNNEAESPNTDSSNVTIQHSDDEKTEDLNTTETNPRDVSRNNSIDSVSDNLDANVNIIPFLIDNMQICNNENVNSVDDKTDINSSDSRNLAKESAADVERLTVPIDEVDACQSRDDSKKPENTINYRRQRLKSISLDSDNAKFIEQNLGLPMVKHLKHKNLYDTCESENCGTSESERYSHQISPVIRSNIKKTLFNFNMDSVDQYMEGYKNPDVKPFEYHMETPTISFSEMEPRFSPKEFESETPDDVKSTNKKNIRNLTIDLNKRDVELEKELSQYECLDSAVEKRVTPKTPTLKIKATSLDSSETLSLSLPQNNTLQVPQNSISVPNTPKRQLKRALTQKGGKLVKASHYNNNYGGNLNEIIPRICSESQHSRKLYMNVKCPSNFIDSGIFLRENHANLMLFQAPKYPMNRESNFNRRMGSFDENMVDHAGTSQMPQPVIDNRLSLLQKPCDVGLLGSNLFKQNLSVSSTNLKTLPEGVPSNDFVSQPEDKSNKKTLLQRRGSNQSLTINLESAGANLRYSALSLQGSNLSLASFGASSHNLANIKNSASNFSLNTDNRQKKNLSERRNSNTSLTLNLDYGSQHGRIYSGSHCNLQGSHYNLTNQDNANSGQGRKLLQRRGSNTSLTLNLQNSNSNLNRCTSSVNIHNEARTVQKKGLLERRSSNTSLTLNINPNSQFDNNRVLSVSNYNLEGAGSGLSRYNSNQSINDQKKGLLERRSSNTSLTLNLNNSNLNLQGSELPRDIEIDDAILQTELGAFKEGENFRPKEHHRKSLSSENLFSKSYKSKFQAQSTEYSFGSHDNIWSTSADSFENITSGRQNLTYICGDQENEMIYAFGDRHHIENAGFQAMPVRNITTKPLSPHSTSEDFKQYLANIQHLQNASNVLSRQQLRDLNSVFHESYMRIDYAPVCPRSSEIEDEKTTEGEYNPQRLLPEPVLESTEYQKSLLRNLHQEFWDLPTNFQEKPMVFGSHPKNRYKTILPNEHSRVILRAELGDTEEGYINANYIKGHEYSKNCYIATQGPLPNTIYDFWLMVYQNACQFHHEGCTKTNEDRNFGSPQPKTKNVDFQLKRSADDHISVQKIVMLTNLFENGRQKCEKYFPTELNDELVFRSPPNSAESGSFFPSDGEDVADDKNLDEVNYFKVKNVGMIRKPGYTVRKLHVEYLNKFLRERQDMLNIPSIEFDADSKTDLIVYHYWFHNWADHKCPQDVSTLLDLSLEVLQDRQIDFDERPNIESDFDPLSRERRLSAFQSAKAFFDEFSKLSAQDEPVKPGRSRKNSLASRLDVPKVKYDILRRESADAIDPAKITIKYEVKKSKKAVQTSPTIVHCSAGIGRTGCLIAVLNGIKQLNADEKVDILGIVCNMRLNRGGMVQNSEQYELIHKVLCLYEEKGLVK